MLCYVLSQYRQNYSHTSIVYLATDLTTYPILNIYQHHSMLHFCTYTGIRFVHIRVFLLQFVWMTSTAFVLISHGGSSRMCQNSKVNSSKYFFLKSDRLDSLFTVPTLPVQCCPIRRKNYGNSKQSCCIARLKLYIKTFNGLIVQQITTL